MVKKIISAALLPILLFQFSSCYNMSAISLEELINQEEKSDLRITTYQSETYEFKSFNYYIKSDTLFGIGEKIIDKHTTAPFSGKIGISDIEYVAASKFNTASTCMATVGISLLAATVILVFLLHEVSEDFNSCNQRSRF